MSKVTQPVASFNPTPSVERFAALSVGVSAAVPPTAGVIGVPVPAAFVDQVAAAARSTAEPVWQLPLDARYRKQLDSQVADLKNLGGEFAGAITAGLFLAEFAGDVPWAHLDIAGTAKADADEAWRVKGATGFGARLLIDVALSFTPPAS